jgi:hypothetical protein
MSKGISPIVAEVLLLSIAIASVSSAAVFLNDTFGGVKEGVDQWREGREEVEQSEIGIEAAYNESGFLAFDVRNEGSRSLDVQDDGEKLWTLYVKRNDGNQNRVEWEYFEGSSYISQSDVLLGVNSDISINTTLEFPDPGNTTTIEIQGPNEVAAGEVCYSQGGSCR